MEKTWDVSDIDLSKIEEITDIFEISNDYRNMFCFTVTLSNHEIINVFKKFTESTREQKSIEIKEEHEKLQNIYDYYKKEYKK